MKKTILGLAVAALVMLFSTAAHAQKEDKQAKKEWEKRKKDMSWQEFKNLVESNAQMTSDLANVKSQNTQLQSDLTAKENDLKRLKLQIEDLKKQVADAKALSEMQDSNEVDASPCNFKMPANGIIFKVQIGAFKNKDLSKYFNNNKNFSGEIDPDGTKKYTLGIFADYFEADNFKRLLREMGVRDAWIVSYKNGKRIDIRQALEELNIKLDPATMNQ